MIDTKLFVNIFTPEETYPSPHSPNISLVPTNLFFDRLTDLCMANGYQFSWRVKSTGRYSNGLGFFNGELVITQRDAQGNLIDEVIRAGSAESGSHNGHLGLSGLSTVALQNAGLRGLRMAEFLYPDEEASAPPMPQQQQPPQFQPPPQVAAPQFTPQPQQFQQPPAPQPPAQQYGRQGQRPFTPRNQQQGNGRFTPAGQGQPPAQQLPWEQDRLTRIPGSGKYAQSQTPYANIPIEDLQKWASGNSPNKYAQYELQYRMNTSGATPPAQQAFQQPGYNQGGYR